METADEPVKHGHLLFLARPGKILKKAWQKKYFALFKASGYAVQRAEMFDTQDQFVQNGSAKIVPLNECIKVAQAPQKNQQNVFEVITKVHTYHYSAETTQDLAEWVQAFQKVAFGGPSSSLSVSSRSPTSSQMSLVLQPGYAEEKVNDIYSPIYGSERYVVQVMETEAANMCGLGGHYQLVVNQLELLLCEAGSSTDDVCLFAWSYRHIRRYGRNKDVFTFEAGRKCASGEGTFKFVTNEANTIFQSVQANTKNIKKDAGGGVGGVDSSDGGGHLGPSSRSGSSRSIPPIRTAYYDGGDENGTADSPWRSVSVDQLSTRTKSGPAPPPFTKPPRKTKTSLDNASSGDVCARVRSAEPIRLEISKAAVARLAKTSGSVASLDDLDSNDGVPTSAGSLEPTYAEPELRMDAWKTYALESDNFHEERLLAEDDPAYYASVPYTPPAILTAASALTRSPVSTEAGDGVPKMVNAAAKRPSIEGVDCYDHLSQFGEPPPPASKSVSSGHHIYSRLLSSSSSTSSDRSVNRTASNDLRSPSSVVTDPLSDGLQRFVQNDDIYTVVLKPSKKGNSAN